MHLRKYVSTWTRYFQSPHCGCVCLPCFRETLLEDLSQGVCCLFCYTVQHGSYRTSMAQTRPICCFDCVVVLYVSLVWLGGSGAGEDGAGGHHGAPFGRRHGPDH